MKYDFTTVKTSTREPLMWSGQVGIVIEYLKPFKDNAVSLQNMISKKTANVISKTLKFLCRLLVFIIRHGRKQFHAPFRGLLNFSSSRAFSHQTLSK